jgi:hypothetical protein
MKKLIAIASIVALTGCSTIKEYWPKNHDPVMFNQLVEIDIAIEKQICEAPTWHLVLSKTEQLARYAEWRQDPQATNLKGLQQHIVRMEKGGSKTFCEIGKRTAQQRVQATRTAWEGR